MDPTREKITSLPSVCLRDSSGLAVSFCLSHQLGVFNHGFTLADYRGKGLIVPVYKRLAQIHLQLGLHPCAFVEVGNVASLKVFVEKLHWDNMNMQFYDFLYRANLRDK